MSTVGDTMERILSVHTVFFFCPREETFSKNNSGQTRVVCCKTGKCLQAQLEIPVSSKVYVSFPFQTLAPGLWLLLLKRMSEPRSPFAPRSGQGRAAQKWTPPHWCPFLQLFPRCVGAQNRAYFEVISQRGAVF